MTIHLVGAVPGDPQLLTRRGATLLAAADHVVYDRPSMAEILALAPTAHRHCVGKQSASRVPPPPCPMNSTHAGLLIPADTPAHRLAPQCKVAATALFVLTDAPAGAYWPYLWHLLLAAAPTIPLPAAIGTILAGGWCRWDYFTAHRSARSPTTGSFVCLS